jgi:hypothetical protein
MAFAMDLPWLLKCFEKIHSSAADWLQLSGEWRLPLCQIRTLRMNMNIVPATHPRAFVPADSQSINVIYLAAGTPLSATTRPFDL